MKITRKRLRRLIETTIKESFLNERPGESLTENHPMIKEFEALFKKAKLVEGRDYANLFNKNKDELTPNYGGEFDWEDQIHYIYFALKPQAALKVLDVFRQTETPEEDLPHVELGEIRYHFDKDIIPYISGKHNLSLKIVKDPDIVSFCNGSLFGERYRSDLLVIADVRLKEYDAVGP